MTRQVRQREWFPRGQEMKSSEKHGIGDYCVILNIKVHD